ncbi:MAG: AAA family ATPase [Caldilineaceae bacterium]
MPKPVQVSSYTLRDILEGGYVYVDKTRDIYELIRYSKGAYFLARPRRFGKSLMISTLYEIFQGNKELFQGLWLYTSDYQWQSYPIIRLDFGRYGVNSAANLVQILDYFLEEIAQQHGITLRGFDYQSRFDNLIQQLGRERKVVILVDEYDKPLIDNLTNLPEAIAMRNILRNFYGVIKAMDQYLRFVFITGITKFSKVGVFSAMNNLDDITMAPRFATSLGITEEELTHYFQEHLTAFATATRTTEAELREKMRDGYDGFCFVENCDNVYNPFSTLQLFHHQRFANFWFETGTPTFLINLLKENEYPVEQLEELWLSELSFSTFEIDALLIVPLLFQTGYLTIKGYEAERQRYLLSYPNTEVKNAFLTHLLSAFSERPRDLNEKHLWQLVDALEAHNLARFFTTLDIFFANVPYDIQLKHEKYYQTLFYLIFKLIGLNIDVEVRTNQGRIDAVVEVTDHIFLFEFKLDGTANDALEQIKTTEYAQKYQGKGKALTLIGANFANAKRKITDWKSDPHTP